MGFGAGVADALTELLRDEFLKAVRRKELAQGDRRINENVRQFDVSAGHEDRRIGQADQRLGLDTRKVDLDEKQFGEQVRQFGIEQPLRGRLQLAQASNLESLPQREQVGREHDLNLTNLRNTHELGQIDRRGSVEGRLIGQRGAEDRLTQAQRPVAGTTREEQKEADEVQQLLDLIADIEKDPALSTSVGAFDGRGLGMVRDMDGYNRFKAKHDQLVGQLQLANAGKLKGQGQVSNIEREMLRQAATALGRQLSEKDYRTELGRIRGVKFRGEAAPQQKSVSMAQLQSLAQAKGTSVEEQKRRAEAEGYIVR